MKRPLTPDEKELWKRVTASAKPLKKDAKMIRDEDVKRVVPKNPHIPAFSHHHIPSSHLHISSYANIDRNTAERFRKGKYKIDATLDLHGLSYERAQAALERFLHSHYGRSRCLLVITGKGSVLREALPRWLAGLSPLLLAFDVAKAKDGGSGAFYVLLKRKR